VSTQFECRLLLGGGYEAAVRDLERVACGEHAALRSIHERLREELERGTFTRWHSPSIGLYLQEEWRRTVDDLPSRASPEAAERISELFIALVCMPDYQMAYEYGTDASPNLVVLAESDGGLYGALADADRWFNHLFFERFPRSRVKYAVGRAMIVLDRADLERLQEAIGKVTDEACRNARAPDGCRDARTRLASLVERCLAVDDGLLAVSESG
jgi:hypothetical protein